MYIPEQTNELKHATRMCVSNVCWRLWMLWETVIRLLYFKTTEEERQYIISIALFYYTATYFGFYQKPSSGIHEGESSS